MSALPETALDLDEVMSALRDAVAAAGSQRAAADRMGVSQAYLADVLHGRRAIGGRVLDALGLERVTLIVPVARQSRS